MSVVVLFGVVLVIVSWVITSLCSVSVLTGLTIGFVVVTAVLVFLAKYKNLTMEAFGILLWIGVFVVIGLAMCWGWHFVFKFYPSAVFH